ncbi:MAG TPA: acyl-CoA dehydrogenase family protein [Polyangiaceae bacterium]|nr:acyl-CoA dehydrogenase family protein [Polyangiaceae bacterium]
MTQTPPPSRRRLDVSHAGSFGPDTEHAQQSFMKSLFFGVIAEGLLFPYPEMSSSEVDQLHLVLGNVRKFFAGHVDSAAIDRDQAIPAAVIAGLEEMGLFGMLVPQAYGGVGMSNSAYARVMQEVGGLDASVGLTLGAHQSIGYEGLLLFGTEDQKRRYLPKLATGEMLAAFVLTEEGAGSDAAAIRTHAELMPDGNYKLSGTKIWITNGGVADLFTVFARTSPRDEGVKPKITAFLVERAFGVKSGPEERKLGIRGSSTTEVFFDDVIVPAANVLGEPGRGFKVAMEVLNSGRLGLAAGCVGACKHLIKLATERVQERRAFGRPIGEFGLIKDKIASMLAETYALESMVYMTTAIVDRRADFSIESAICKVHGSETLWRVVNEALQIAAGIGYMEDFPYARHLRDARINLIFEGTNEILRCFIALAGMSGPGQTLADVAKAMREPIKGFGLLSDFAIRKARSAFGRERVLGAHPVLNREAVVFEEYAAELGRNVEKVLRKHGHNIAEMQYTQRRLANVAIDLYAIASLLSRTTRKLERHGEEGARREVELTSMFVSMAQGRLRANIDSFEHNDDELRKSIADRAYVDGGYPFDVI